MFDWIILFWCQIVVGKREQCTISGIQWENWIKGDGTEQGLPDKDANLM